MVIHEDFFSIPGLGGGGGGGGGFGGLGESAVRNIASRIANDVVNAAVINPLRRALNAAGLSVFTSYLGTITQQLQNLINMTIGIIGIAFEFLEYAFTILSLIIELGTKIGYYIARPFELVVILIKFVILVVTLCVSFIYHKISLTNNLRAAEMLVYVVILFTLYTPVMCIAILTWAVYRYFIEYTCLYAIDKKVDGVISSFIYRYFTACENPPDAWYMTPSWHDGNKNDKYIFAFNSCPMGYSATNVFGLFCEQNDKYELSVCPQANIYRVANNMRPMGDLKNKIFNDMDPTFMKQNKFKKTQTIHEYKEKIITNNAKCRDAIADKNTILKSYCMGYDENGTNIKYKKEFNQLCYDVYCADSERAPFCHKLSHDTTIGKVKNSSNIDTMIHILIMSAVITLAVARLAD